MDLRQLRYFVAIAERGSFSAAASAGNVAQSALSRHMQLLEHEFGGALFERGSRGVALTEPGRLLLQRARYLLGEIDNLRAEVSLENRNPSGRVRLGAPSTLADLLFLPLARRFAEHFPRITVQLSEGLTEELTSRLLLGALDLAILSGPRPNDHLDYETLFTEPVYLIGPPGDPLLARRDITPGEIPALRLILALSGSGQDAFPGRPQSNLQVDSMVPLKQMVAAGLGYGFLPYSGISRELEERTLSGAPLAWLNTARVLALPRDRPASRATREMINAVKVEGRALIEAGKIQILSTSSRTHPRKPASSR